MFTRFYPLFVSCLILFAKPALCQSITKGSVIPRLNWVDGTVRQDVVFLGASKDSVVLNVGGKVHRLPKTQFVKLYKVSTSVDAVLLPNNANVVIHPLTYSNSPPKGRASTETMRIERNSGEDAKELDDRLLEIGLIGNVPVGIGTTLRASLWNAASIAGKIKADPLFDTSLYLRLKGSVDGPSAGGLFTIATLAMLQGDPLIPNVTMTGTILPDGGIGSVGGVRYKIEGAAEAGMKKIVLPEYLRVEVDFKNGDITDLEEHARKNGLEVAFVSNVEEAYAHFTGKQLRVAGRSSLTTSLPKIEMSIGMTNMVKHATRKRFKDTFKFMDLIPEGKLPKDLEFDTLAMKFAVNQIFRSELDDVKSHLYNAASRMQEGQWIAAFEETNLAWINIRALCHWQKLKFIMPKEDSLQKALSKEMLKVLQKRDFLAGANTGNEVERTILHVRAFQEGLSLYSDLQIKNEIAEYLNEGLAEKFKNASNEEEKKEALEQAINSYKLHAVQSLQTLKLMAISGAPSLGQAEVDLDLLAGAFTFRGADTATSSKLDPLKVRKWLLFGETRNRVLFENLREIVKDSDDNSMLDLDIRKAIALIEFQDQQGEQILADIANEDSTLGLFATAVLLARQEVDIAMAIIKSEVFNYEEAAFRGMLEHLGRLLTNPSSQPTSAIRCMARGMTSCGPKNFGSGILISNFNLCASTCQSLRYAVSFRLVAAIPPSAPSFLFRILCNGSSDAVMNFTSRN